MTLLETAKKYLGDSAHVGEEYCNSCKRGHLYVSFNVRHFVERIGTHMSSVELEEKALRGAVEAITGSWCKMIEEESFGLCQECFHAESDHTVMGCVDCECKKVFDD